jgi:hypothetical protein
MSILSRLLGSIREQYVARPSSAERQLIFKHPSINVVRGTRLTVRVDECAVFFRHGRLFGELGPGEHVLDSSGIPFLDPLFVRPLTGGDHFIAEIFFVREAEHLHQFTRRTIGTFTDNQSQLVVQIEAEARFGVRVTEPARLIATLGGQADSAGDTVGAYLDGRIRSFLAGLVGQLVEREPVLSVVSNTRSEDLGQRVRGLVEGEFTTNGLEFVRFLDLGLHLDDESATALRSFGEARSKLAIQREGAELASAPGFATFNLVQGQRAALEGLGEGLSHGMIVPLVGGLPNLGLAPSAIPRAGAAMLPPILMPPPAETDAHQQPWYMQSPRGIVGPLNLKQLALRIRGDRLEPSETRVRGGLGAWVPASSVAELVAQLAPNPSTPPMRASEPASHEALERALVGGALTAEELQKVVDLLTLELPCVPRDRLRAQVLERALARGIEVASLPEAEPSYTLFDGDDTWESLSAAEVVDRIRLAPERPWRVLAADTKWQRPAAVPAIALLLSSS